MGVVERRHESALPLQATVPVSIYMHDVLLDVSYGALLMLPIPHIQAFHADLCQTAVSVTLKLLAAIFTGVRTTPNQGGQARLIPWLQRSLCVP